MTHPQASVRNPRSRTRLMTRSSVATKSKLRTAEVRVGSTSVVHQGLRFLFGKSRNSGQAITASRDAVWLLRCARWCTSDTVGSASIHWIAFADETRMLDALGTERARGSVPGMLLIAALAYS